MQTTNRKGPERRYPHSRALLDAMPQGIEIEDATAQVFLCIPATEYLTVGNSLGVRLLVQRS